jgi:hypothetical protein
MGMNRLPDKLRLTLRRKLLNAHNPLAPQLGRYVIKRQRPYGIILPEVKLLYIPVTKVANRSIKAALANHVGLPYKDPHEADWQKVPLSAVATLTDYFRFTFVRNPLDRLLSCYAQKIVLYARQLQLPLLFWQYKDLFTADMSFADFVRAVASIPDAQAELHFRSQHTFIYHQGNCLVNFIGRVEHLSHDWLSLRQQVGLGKLPHYNRSNHQPHTKVYTPELARLAANRNQQDIELLGYAADIEPLL